MKSSLARRCFQLLPVLLAAVLLLTDSRPAAAEARCFENLRDCYGRAATRDGVWDMWAAGLDCELDLVDCVRRALLGR
jgi:hypothetical protein